MKAHDATQVMTPDEIAETVEGITQDTYRELWASIDYVPEVLQEHYGQIRNTAQVWDHLSEDAQRNINEALAAQDAEWGIA